MEIRVVGKFSWKDRGVVEISKWKQSWKMTDEVGIVWINLGQTI